MGNKKNSDRMFKTMNTRMPKNQAKKKLSGQIGLCMGKKSFKKHMLAI